MKICYFGSYDKNYSKNVVLLKGLRKNGIRIAHCHHPHFFPLSHCPSLFWQFLKRGRDCDIIFVAFFGHYDVWFAWILAKIFRKKLVFDPLISIYNTRVEDRKYFKPKSLRAKFYKVFDCINVHLADHVFMDSYAQLNYFHKRFGLRKEKSTVIRLGADESVLKPTKRQLGKNLLVIFFGSYQPSQDAKKIIEAAEILKTKNTDWLFIGDGQDRPQVENYAKKKKLAKVKFLNFMPFGDLIKYIDRADIVFGAFGRTSKAKIVLHNKIYQAMAMGKTLITQDTPAVREIVEDDNTAFLVQPSAKAIAAKILELEGNRNKILEVGRNARRKFISNFSSYEIGRQARKVFERIIKN